MSDDPPFLPVGTEISAKFKGAFCEAKVKKVVRNVKCKVTFKDVQGGSAVLDEGSIKGTLRVGALLPVVHPDTKLVVSAVLQNIKDCSTYTAVFDDGDERVLRRTQMCLKGGKHFHASESLDVMPLTKPEQFGAPVVGRRKGGRRKRTLGASAAVEAESDASSSTDDDETVSGTTTRGVSVDESAEGGADADAKRNPPTNQGPSSFYAGGSQSSDYGRVVCVFEQTESRRWFPALIVSPKMKRNLKINVNEEYLVRSFKDGRCLAVQKARVQDFNLSKGKKVDIPSIKSAVEKAILYLEKDELPSNWDRELLLGDREDDDAADRASSPGSVGSLADAASATNDSADEPWNADRQANDEEPSANDGKNKRRSDGRSTSAPPDSAADQERGDSDIGDRSSEVGMRRGKASHGADAQSPRASPTSRSSSVPRRRPTGGAKRRAQCQQQRRRTSVVPVSTERKDRFVAQLYKFMDERGTPLNKAPVLAGKELDLYLFYDTIRKLGGYNRVCHKGEWKTVIKRMKLIGATPVTVKNAYNKYLFSFDSFYRKLGCALSDLKSPPGGSRVNRRERHASKSGTKPSTSSDVMTESTRRQTSLSRTSSMGKDTAMKTQKFATSLVSKPVPSEFSGRTTPKVSSSREASKERSASPVPTFPHPPVTNEDLVVGARVKVQYGYGTHRKLYQAKIVKVWSSENRYVVHYLGWNTRYDESVPKSRIVEVLSPVTAASSDSGGSNNDQSEHGASLSGQKIIRSNSRSRIEKSRLWRRRRSSGGSTHSLPIGVATSDDGNGGASARKSSSISATSWRKAAATGPIDDEGNESGKDSSALLSTYRSKPAVTSTLSAEPAQSAPVKRPASANAAADAREVPAETGGPAVDGPPPAKRGKRSANTGLSSGNKRKKSMGDSDEEETKRGSGNSRRVSKRLRGVKASIEEEISKQMESAHSEDEGDSPATAKDTGSGDVESTTTNPVEGPARSPSTATDEMTAVTKDNGDEKEAADDKEQGTDCHEEPPAKTEQVADTKKTETEKRKEVPSSSQASGPSRARNAKMRRRRRNYSHMVTDHRGRSTAAKAVKKDVDSDGEGGGHVAGGSSGAVANTGNRHNEGASPRDPNSLHALRHRIQAEMDVDGSKFPSNFAFNFIDENLDGERKIQLMQTNIAELKETYLRIRSELSAFEKCRKKLLEKKRKQERRASKSSSKKPNLPMSTDKKTVAASSVGQSEQSKESETAGPSGIKLETGE